MPNQIGQLFVFLDRGSIKISMTLAAAQELDYELGMSYTSEF